MAAILHPASSAPTRAARILRLPPIARAAYPRARKLAGIALTILFLGYIVTLGARYGNASGQAADLSSRSGVLSQAVNRPLPSGQAQASALASAEARAQQIELLFTSATSDTLLTVVSEGAGEAGLTLASVTIGEPKVQVFGAVQYRALPMTLVLSGPADRVPGYLAIIRTRSPAVSVGSIRTHRTGTTETSRVTLQFYADPSPVEKPARKSP